MALSRRSMGLSSLHHHDKAVDRRLVGWEVLVPVLAAQARVGRLNGARVHLLHLLGRRMAHGSLLLNRDGDRALNPLLTGYGTTHQSLDRRTMFRWGINNRRRTRANEAAPSIGD